MSEDRRTSPREQVYADLIAGLLDVREDPTTEHFDQELDRLMAEDGLRGESATRLRFWQRAAVRALADHIQVVLPTALAALETSRDEARTAADELERTLGQPTEVVQPDMPTDASTSPGSADTSRHIVAGLVTLPAEPRLLSS